MFQISVMGAVIIGSIIWLLMIQSSSGSFYNSYECNSIITLIALVGNASSSSCDKRRVI